MSQEKVEKYKQEKANRKKNIKKEKRLHILRVIFYSLIALAILGFLGWSVYDKFLREDETPPTMSQEEWSSMLEEYMATYVPTEAVTDKNGETVTEAMTNEQGETYTEAVTDEEGQTVTDKDGNAKTAIATQVVTQTVATTESSEAKSSSTEKADDKETSTEAK